MMSIRRVFLTLLALAFLATLPVLVLAGPPAQEQVTGNLLVDGDFEVPPTWPFQDGIGEVQVAPGWRAYYLDAAPAYAISPENCSEHPHDTTCYWMRPEFRDSSSFANRIHSGARSQKYFSYGRMHEAGLMQQVSGIPPGARARFSIWIQAWMCSDPSACGKDGTRSDAPSDMHLRVGIDPWGGTDPFTTTVVWSAEMPAWDEWGLFQVETTAMTNTVTVFTHSRPEWTWARKNNDVYLDDASLVIVGAYTTPDSQTTPGHMVTATLTPQATLGPTGTARSPTATPTRAVSSPTATPFPAGAITYTIQMGDTLFDIALKHGTTVKELLELNRITGNAELYIGQSIVIRIMPTPTPRPEASPTQATPKPGATASPGLALSPTLTPTAILTPAPTLPLSETRPLELPVMAITLIGGGLFVVALGIGIRLTALKGRAKSARIQAKRPRGRN